MSDFWKNIEAKRQERLKYEEEVLGIDHGLKKPKDEKVKAKPKKKPTGKAHGAAGKRPLPGGGSTPKFSRKEMYDLYVTHGLNARQIALKMGASYDTVLRGLKQTTAYQDQPEPEVQLCGKGLHDMSDPKNVRYRKKDGYRFCWECRKEANRRWRRQHYIPVSERPADAPDKRYRDPSDYRAS